MPGPRLFREWVRAAGVLSLGLLLACQGVGTAPATGEAGAPANAGAPLPAPAGTAAPSAVYTLLIDGAPQPVQSADLAMLKAKGGFTMGFEAGPVKVQVIGGPKAPLVVGKYAIRDTASAVLLTGNLPTESGKEKGQQEGLDGFSAPFFISVPAGTPLGTFIIYDWGQGLQELRGRPLGQLVFTRLGDGTADGSFQSLVYRFVTRESQPIEYQGRPRVLFKLKEHTVKGTFKNMPVADYEQAMGDLQKALEAAKGLR